MAAAAAAVAAAAAPASSASFTAPVELATDPISVAAAAATDAAGTTTAVITGSGAPRLLERAPGAPWPTATPLPGDPLGVSGPVVAAAGRGALGIAWRVDRPRKYAGIQVAVRDPGGALSTPIDVAGSDAGGVRHPALAVDPAGDALVAYNTATRETHLNQRGGIAVAYRPGRGSFSAPVVLDDTPSAPPAVALAPDGTGIVAWTHNRRVYAVSIADGRLGRVKEVGASRGLRSVVAAAGPGGAATIAWVRHGAGGRAYEIRALRRSPGRAFGAAQAVGTTSNVIQEVALAADEAGRTTAAWTEQDFRRRGPSGRILSSVHVATAAGRAFGPPRVVVQSAARERRSLSIAAANGRVALAWGVFRDSLHLGVQAAVGPAGALGPVQTVATATLSRTFFSFVPTARVGLGPQGRATVLTVLPYEPTPPVVERRLVAADGP